MNNVISDKCTAHARNSSAITSVEIDSAISVSPPIQEYPMKKKLLALAATSLIALSACGADGSTSDTTVPSSDTSEVVAEPGTIVEVAQSNADFSTLVAAVTAAGLGDALSGEGPLTVFAPTNAAFEALPEGLLEKLLLPENKEILTKILTYHVVGAKVMAADVAAGDVTTLEGSTFAVTTDGGVKINGTSTVTATDIAASNGVIHVIDAVIVPPTVDLSKL
jgi:uncharacterized surface protein with fasciclin (FAS1) repeats